MVARLTDLYNTLFKESSSLQRVKISNIMSSIKEGQRERKGKLPPSFTAEHIYQVRRTGK